jgi:hypothetical protein
VTYEWYVPPFPTSIFDPLDLYPDNVAVGSAGPNTVSAPGKPIGLLPRHSPELTGFGYAYEQRTQMQLPSSRRSSRSDGLRLVVSRGIGVIDTSSFVLARQVHGIQRVDVFVVRVCTRSLHSTPVFVFHSRTEHTKCNLCDERKKPVQTSSTDFVAYKQTQTTTTTTSFHSYQHRI